MVLRVLDRLEEWIIATLIAAATVLIFLAVLHRYGTGLSIEESGKSAGEIKTRGGTARPVGATSIAGSHEQEDSAVAKRRRHDSTISPRAGKKEPKPQIKKH